MIVHLFRELWLTEMYGVMSAVPDHGMDVYPVGAAVAVFCPADAKGFALAPAR